jgi:hypothetical protein
MIKFLVALRMRDHCPGLQISNFSMPYWVLDYPPIPQQPDENIFADATIHWGVRADHILDAHATIEGQWSMVDPAR